MPFLSASDSFFGIEVSLHGYQVLACNSEDSLSLEKTLVENLLSRMVDGLVVAPAAGKTNVPFLKRRKSGGS